MCKFKENGACKIPESSGGPYLKLRLSGCARASWPQRVSEVAASMRQGVPCCSPCVVPQSDTSLLVDERLIGCAYEAWEYILQFARLHSLTIEMLEDEK